MAGNEDLQAGKFEDAESQYKNALEALKMTFPPQDTQPRLSIATDALTVAVHANLALLASKRQRPGDVVQHASQALKLQPRHTKALYRRARAYLALNDLDKAQADAKALVQLQVAEAEAPTGMSPAAVAEAAAPSGITSSVAGLVRDITAARVASSAAAKDMAGKMFGGGPRQRKGKKAGLGSLYEDMHDYGDKTNRGLKHPGVARCKRRWEVPEDPRDPTVQCSRAGDGVRLMVGGPSPADVQCSFTICCRSCCSALTLDCMDCCVECSDDCGYQPSLMRCIRRSDESLSAWCASFSGWYPSFAFTVDRILCGPLALVWQGYIWSLDKVGEYFTNPAMLRELHRAGQEQQAQEQEAAAPTQVRRGVRDTGSDDEDSDDASDERAPVVEAGEGGDYDLSPQS